MLQELIGVAFDEADDLHSTHSTSWEASKTFTTKESPSPRLPDSLWSSSEALAS